MNKTPLCPRGLQIFLVCVVIVVTLMLLAAPSIQDLVHALREVTTRPPCETVLNPPPSRCEFPLVYNKPPKTASTKIRDDMSKWGSTVKRRVYRCSPYTRQATFQMRECIPEAKDGCAIIATHMKLSNTMRELLTSKIGDFKLLTSTRNPQDRLFSMFLQVKGLQASNIRGNFTILHNFLSEYNPWDLYNYHTGEGRQGSCPLTLQEVAIVTDLVNRADIVIDADLQDISNAILNHMNLFQLSDSVLNRRSREEVVFDEETEQAFKNISCVEQEMHRMFRLRMASLYQKATGIKCLSNTRYPTPTCF